MNKETEETVEFLSGLDPESLRKYEPRSARGLVIKQVIIAAMDGDIGSARLVFSSLARKTNKHSPRRVVIVPTEER